MAFWALSSASFFLDLGVRERRKSIRIRAWTSICLWKVKSLIWVELAGIFAVATMSLPRVQIDPYSLNTSD